MSYLMAKHMLKEIHDTMELLKKENECMLYLKVLEMSSLHACWFKCHVKFLYLVRTLVKCHVKCIWFLYFFNWYCNRLHLRHSSWHGIFLWGCNHHMKEFKIERILWGGRWHGETLRGGDFRLRWDFLRTATMESLILWTFFRSLFWKL